MPLLPGVADGGGDRRVGHGDDDVGVDAGDSRGELVAEPLAHVVDVAAVPHGVGAGEVDELERAAGRRGAGRERLVAGDLGALQRDDLAGRDLVDVDAAERGERARLARRRRTRRVAGGRRQRPEAPRVAHGDHPVAGEDHEREGALPRRQRALDALLPRRARRRRRASASTPRCRWWR